MSAAISVENAIPDTDDSVLGNLLEGRPLPARVELTQRSWGFGAIHGGLQLATLTAAMERESGGLPLRMVRGRFLRALRGGFDVATEIQRAGRSTTELTARASVDGETFTTASAVFAAPAGTGIRAIAPVMPDVPPPEACPVFTVPPEFVPFASRTEIRPANDSRPYAGGTEPELVAWMRLVADDTAPDAVRLTILMDALAPSYAAVLPRPAGIPTVELQVRPAEALAEAESPWVLLRARTTSASADGWIDEQMDVWDPAGRHLGSGHQLRVMARS